MNTESISTASFVRSSVIIRSGIDKYCEMISLYDHGKGCGDARFQRLYTYFYRVRRSAAWLGAYYNLMGELSQMPDTPFSECLRLTDAIDGSGVEVSFASKMFHTLNPDMPIWDSQVKKSLGLGDVPMNGAREEREGAAVALYSELRDRFAGLLALESVRKEIKEFDRLLPEYADKVSATKKLDFLLWSAGR